MHKKISALLILCFLLSFPVLAGAENKVPDLPNSAVTIPWSDFKELIKDLIAPPPPPPAPSTPPSDFSVSAVSYIGRVEGGNAVFSSSFTLTVLANDKWVEVPLLPDTVAVSDVTMDGVAVTLAVKGGSYVIVTDKPGKHVVNLKFFVPAEVGSGKDSLSMAVPRVPASTLSFTVPKPGLDFEVSPAYYKRVIPGGGATTVEAVLPVTGSLTISWSPAVREEVSGALRVQAQVNTLLSVGEGIVKGVTTVTYDITHGSLTSFEIVVPASIEIIDVQGDAVRDWKVIPDGDRVTVAVNAKFDVSGETSIVLLYEKTMGGTTADVQAPEIEVKDVVRETGYLAVTSSTKVGVEERSSKNLANLDTTELPPDLVSASENPILFSYKYIKHPYSLKLGVVTYQDIPSLTTVITKTDISSLLTVRGDFVTRTVFEVKNNVKQFMKIVLPEHSTLWSAYVADRPVKPSIDKDGAILIPLDRSTRTDTTLTSFTVEIVYLTETKALGRLVGRRHFTAPIVDIQTDAVAWTVYLPEKFAYKNIGKDMERAAPPSITYGTGMEVNAPAVIPEEDMSTSDEMFYGDMERKKERGREPESQVNLEKNIYAEGLSSIGGGVGMRGVLPVKLDIPFSGYSLAYKKVIVKPGEKSTVTIRYEGSWFSRILFYLGIFLSAVLFLCVALTVRRSIAIKKPAFDRETAVVFAGALVLIILVSLFLILDSGSIWWGLLIALLVVGGFFARELAVRFKELVRRSKEEQVKRERESKRREKGNEK